MAKNQIDITIRAFNLAKKELDSLNKQLGNVDKVGKQTSKGMGMLGKAIAGIGFAAMAKQAAKFVFESTKLAARVETLGIVTQTLGRNAGYSTYEIDMLERAIQKQGITTQASRQSLALMMQAQLDLADSTDLARLAQDAAVIAGTNSSEAFQRLINVITTGNVRMARTMGLQVDFNAGYQEMAEKLGKTTEELTAQEKAQSRTNSVMGEGVQIAGAYEAAMESTGKQLESTARYWEEFRVAIGKANVGLLAHVNTGVQKWLDKQTKLIILKELEAEAWEHNLIQGQDLQDMNLALADSLLTEGEAVEQLQAKLDEYYLMQEGKRSEHAAILESVREVTTAYVEMGEGVAGVAPKSEIGIKALEKFASSALAAAQINAEVEIAAVDGFTEEELTNIEGYADAWGIDLPDGFREMARNFNITSGNVEDGMDILITQVAVYEAALRNAGRLEADLAGPPAAGTPKPPKYKPQARGGELADVALVGEKGYELIINGVVIPHAQSKKLIDLGMAVPPNAYASGGRLENFIDGYALPSGVATPTYTAPAPPKRQRRARAEQSSAQAAEQMAASRAQEQLLMDVNDTLSTLATAEDMEQAMLNAVNLAML